MTQWSRLPTELVDSILEHAFINSLQASRRWAASLLLVSKSAQRWLAPRLYHTLRVTDTNAPAFIRLIDESHPSLLLVRTLIFDCGPESRTFLQEVRIDILAQADITRYSGPRYIFAMLALCKAHPSFAPTHIRVDNVDVAALLRHDLSSVFSRLTHLSVAYLPPIWSHQSHLETLYVPPTLRVVILRPLRSRAAYFDDHQDVQPFFTNGLERLTVRLPSFPGALERAFASTALRTWARERKETRLYVTFDADAVFDIDDDTHWLIGERVI